QDRLAIWDKLKQSHLGDLAAKSPEKIEITFLDGSIVDARSWRTTPYHVAKKFNQDLADTYVVAKVNGVLWDLDRPFEESAKLELLTFDDEEAQQVFWHSTAHILGEAMERVYGGCLCYGPPIENGFYYDIFLNGRQVTQSHYNILETEMKSIVKEKQKFERLEVRTEVIMEIFKYNPFKIRILNEKVDTPTTTIYKCGTLIDLCRGPHVRHTGKVKAIKITKNSASYWEGKADQESLQRVYGISFPDSEQLKEWIEFQEEAAKRDHRKIGKEQELFFFHELSPGSCIFLPKGAWIHNKLIEFLREEYWKRGFQEVVSANIHNVKLWEISGHWAHYAANMFSFAVEKETYALKPMNCPGHCLLFDFRPRSWRELPLRIADFGVLHRNELSGTLSSLTRVRRFQQDDAHIFCTIDQIKDEISGALDFLNHVYSVFGFTLQLKLSTRPVTFLGEISVWDDAEKQLADSLDAFGYPWTLNPGDGAFYGPKIDITLNDALKRPFQCATIQLDFQLPIQFNLNYINDNGDKIRPVIIHRAILGSVERMIAIITESCAGKWPFWLSPRQCIVIPVGPQFDAYAQEVKKNIHDAGFVCEADVDSGDTMNKKIRNAQLAQYNFILVVGEREKTARTVNVRTRDQKVHGEFSILEVVEKFNALKSSRTNCEDTF
ncbi:threonine--tRNA ligase 1, cytoplasmic-like, partial [Cloeon dipterum]|uniref:threonine--tRNA ligase 1, cytoplasmic-like n=1 Tax=Cloeon dipterum TaxID=197152 RepID=UPI0032202A82